MNQKVYRVLSRCLCLGALLCSASLAGADTFITFQVDMSSRIGVDFNPKTDQVAARGTFNNYGQLFLTNNPAAANTNLYTGTVDDTADTNGMQMQYKYWTTVGGWESANKANGNNRIEMLPTNSGASLVLPVQTYDDSGAVTNTAVTFQVDMSEQVELGSFNPGNGDTVVVTGSFDGWPSSGETMTPEAGNTNIWSATVNVNDPPGAFENFKFVTQPAVGWESLPNDVNVDQYSGNRFFDNVTQTLPPVFFNEVPFSALSVTNDVTFEIDMSVQEAVGAFTNGLSTIEIHGDFDGWGSGLTMTNNPGSANPNLYSTVIQYTGGPGTTHNYKYVMQPGTVWENVPLSGGNRYFQLPHTNGNFTIGPDYFSFEDPSQISDFVTVPTMVTFTVNMTNAVGNANDPVTFDPSVNQVLINGLNGGNQNSFWTWGPGNAPSDAVMTRIGNSLLYTATLPINRGQTLSLTYKYSIDAFDDEAGFGDNHVRYIRSLGNYTMPVDTFGAQGNSSSNEPSFGDFTAVKSGNNLTLTWLGRPGVHLQSTTNLHGGTWTPDYNTDGTNLIVAPGGMATTNVPIGGGNKFYELVQPQ